MGLISLTRSPSYCSICISLVIFLSKVVIIMVQVSTLTKERIDKKKKKTSEVRKENYFFCIPYDHSMVSSDYWLSLSGGRGRSANLTQPDCKVKERWNATRWKKLTRRKRIFFVWLNQMKKVNETQTCIWLENQMDQVLVALSCVTCMSCIELLEEHNLHGEKPSFWETMLKILL